MIFHRVEEKSYRFFFRNTKAKSKDIYLLIGVCFKKIEWQNKKELNKGKGIKDKTHRTKKNVIEFQSCIERKQSTRKQKK